MIAAAPRRLFVPSRQQAAFLESLERDDSHMLLEARAGSGKSTTCREGAWTLGRRRSLYCAFNKAIAADFQRDLPRTCRAGTLHSLGLQLLRSHVRRLTGRNVEIDKNGEKVKDIASGIFYKNDSQSAGARSAMARLISNCKNRLAEPDPEFLDFAADDWGIEIPEDLREIVLESIAPAMVELAAEPTRADFDDMLWLPVVLGAENPFPPAVLFVDEAQDLNLCQHALLDKICPQGRIVAVGDRHQCQPAGTMVAMTGGQWKPIEEVAVGDSVVSFSRRSSAMVGRRGRGEMVLGTADREYSGPILAIHASGMETECTPDHKWVARFNSRSTDISVTYLMKRGDRYRVGWCQLFTKQGRLHLGQRARLEKAEAAWILGVHRERTNASIEESVIAATHGIPTITFEPVNGAKHLTASAIDRVFCTLAANNIPLESRAESCLWEFGRNIDHPFYTADERKHQGRTTVFITQACNLIPEIMAIPVYDGSRNANWTPIGRVAHRFATNERVYSLKVAGEETYIADGLATHNSIYAFRGADTQSIPRLAARLGTRGPRGVARFPLTVSRRCPRAVVELARKIVPDLEAAPGAPEGMVDILESEDWPLLAEPGSMILCRTNAPLVSACYQLWRMNRAAKIQGRDIGEGLAAFVLARRATDVADLLAKVDAHEAAEIARMSKRPNPPTDAIQALRDRADCVRALAHGIETIAGILERISAMFADLNDENAVTLSSIHRSKGLERDRVIIIRPDLIPGPWAKSADDRQQELNLAYVAATRAKRHLVICGDLPSVFA